MPQPKRAPSQQRTDRLTVPGHLYAAKLTALARRITDDPFESCESPGQAGGFSRSAADEQEGKRQGLILAEGAGAIGVLGPALLWAKKHDVATLHLLSDDAAPHLVRRAQWFESLGVSLEVWQIHGTEVVVAEAAPIAEVPELGADIWALAGVMTESGARVVDDHGRLVAEVAGLEIARVERDPQGLPVIEVGVGQADRELHHLVHSNLDIDTALKRAVGMVAAHRSPGAPPHPLNRLARERWLRSLVLDDPSLVGATTLEPVPPLRPRSTLLGTQPVAAVGTTTEGSPVVVVTSVGVDPDLAPEAADYRGRTNPDASLIVVVPPRDTYQLTVDLVDALGRAKLVSLEPPWA
ncbi:MAG: hypothetical protein ACI8TP_004689 [Acidimicrobiales bacterium]